MYNFLKKRVSIFLSFVLLLIFLVGCNNIIKVENTNYEYSSDTTTSKEIDNEQRINEIIKEAKKQAKEMVLAIDGVADCDVYLKDKKELVYEYIYEDGVTLSDEQRVDMKNRIDTYVSSSFKSIKDELKIDDLIVTYRYLYNDKTVALESSFNESDVEKIKIDTNNTKKKIVPKSKEELAKIIENSKKDAYNALMTNKQYSDFNLYLNGENELVSEYTFAEGIVIDKQKLNDVKQIFDGMVSVSYTLMQEELGIEDLILSYRFLYQDGTVALKLIYDKDIIESLKN